MIGVHKRLGIKGGKTGYESFFEYSLRAYNELIFVSMMVHAMALKKRTP